MTQFGQKPCTTSLQWDNAMRCKSWDDRRVELPARATNRSWEQL